MILSLKTKSILVFFAVFASFLYIIHVQAFAQDAEADTSFPQGNFSALRDMGKADVLEVITPYTIKLNNGDIIRLSGLHMTDYTADHAGPFALTALKIMKDMLEDESVTIYQTTRKDWGRKNRMGHTLAHLVRNKDNAWAQGTLVGLGLAQVKTSQRNPEMAEQLYALEKAARLDKTGIWANEKLVLSVEDTTNHINSFQIVKGVVQSAALKKNRVYLNFGKNWRDDFTITIAPEDKRFFTKAGHNPLDWNGKKIRVRGWIEDYNGPNIEINHPQSLEVLE